MSVTCNNNTSVSSRKPPPCGSLSQRGRTPAAANEFHIRINMHPIRPAKTMPADVIRSRSAIRSCGEKFTSSHCGHTLNPAGWNGAVVIHFCVVACWVCSGQHIHACMDGWMDVSRLQIAWNVNITCRTCWRKINIVMGFKRSTGVVVFSQSVVVFNSQSTMAT
jgi:hypothetical protein